MPSVFVVSEVGPLESNIYRAIEHEPPTVLVHGLPEKFMTIVVFVWRIYGEREMEVLIRLAAQGPALKETKSVSGLAEITDLDAMPRHHALIKKSTFLEKISGKFLDDVLDFFDDIISAARY